MSDEFEPDPDYIVRRRLPDGRLLAVVPLLFGRAQIGVGDNTGFTDVW